MTHYIATQVAAFNDGYGRAICKDLRGLMHEWLIQDPDLQFVLNRKEDDCYCTIFKGLYCVLKHVGKQNTEICLAAVQRDGHSLAFVENQTDEICLAAVQQHGGAIQYVENQTEALCLAAVQRNGMALNFVRNQTEAVCRAAVVADPDARCYIKIPVDF
jgi:hypothetical protein